MPEETEETQEPTDLRSAIEAAMEPEEPEKAPDTSSSAQVEPEPEVTPPPRSTSRRWLGRDGRRDTSFFCRDRPYRPT